MEKLLGAGIIGIEIVGTYLWLAGVDQWDVLGMIAGGGIMVAGIALYKVSEILALRKEEREEAERARKDMVFAAWLRNPLK